MKKKAIATTILFLFSAFTLALLVSACALFQDPQKDSYVLTGQDAEKFIGSVRVHRGDAEHHYALACHLQERKRHKPAIEEFKMAVETDPGHVKAYNAMGVSYDALGDHARATASYAVALEIDQKLDYVLNNLGYSYLLQGRTDLAIENFKKAIALDSRNARYRNNLALAYAKNGQYDAALTEFKEGGDEARAHFNIAQLYYREGLYKEAGAHFAESSVLKPSDPETGKGLKAAGTLAEIFTKSERAPERAPEIMVKNSETKPIEYDEGGFSTIPPGALKSYQTSEVAEAGLDEKPVFSRAYVRMKIREEARGEAVKIPKAEVLKTEKPEFYTEAQAIELLALQAADEENRPTPRIKIEVSNGNGVTRMARKVGDYLRGNGVSLMYLTNARHFNHEETRIYYSGGYLREAYQIAQKLPGRQRLEEVTTVRGGNAEISILIGKDLVPHLAMFQKG
jgi:tetratricopeptide (TPR) repeat protein